MNLIESETTGYEFEPKRVKNRNTQQIGVYSRYTTTIMDVNKETFRDAISINKYIENECFINSIYDFYHDKLLSPDRKRNRITRAKILEIIGRTEEDVKNGISIEDIMPFFIKFNLKLRVYDRFMREIHRYDPPRFDNNNPVMSCMQAFGHIYTLNHDNKRLAQLHMEDMDEIERKLIVSNDYKVNEESKPVKRSEEHTSELQSH